MIRYFLSSSLCLVVYHFKALFAVIHIYFLGLYYAFLEFSIDFGKGHKFMQKNKLFISMLKEWKQTSPMLNINNNKSSDFQQCSRPNNNRDQEEEEYSLTAVLTGADGTIGSELLDYLLSLDFFVFVIGINPPSISSERIKYVKCDLSARNEVFEAVESILLASQHIDLLILNAAMMLYPNGWFSFFPFRLDVFGTRIIEPHFAINVLANAQLFASFSQRLENSQCSSPRAIFLSSCTAHAGDVSLLLKDEESFWCSHLNGYKAYADSKLLLSTYVKYLSRILKYRDSKISVASVHPGIVPGKLYRNVFAPFRWLINIVLRPFLRSPLLAATCILDLAFKGNVQNGAYYENGTEISLRGFDDPEYVWMIGTSVREMIVCSSDNSPIRLIQFSAVKYVCDRKKQEIAHVFVF